MVAEASPPLADRIKRMRFELRMNQAQFGRLLNVSRTTISHWERGHIQPESETIIDLALTGLQGQLETLKRERNTWRK